MCQQYLCIICDRPLTGYGFFQNCAFNPDARPPWLQQWISKPQCSRPAYRYSDTCHVICNHLKLQAQATIQQHLGIAAVIGRSGGFVDWQRSPYSMLSEQEMEIPQARLLLLGQPPQNFHFGPPPQNVRLGPPPQNVHLGHPRNAREAVTVPTQEVLEAHDQEQQTNTQGNFTSQIQQRPWAGSTPSFAPQMPNESNPSVPSPGVFNQGYLASDQQLMEWESGQEDDQLFYEGP